MCKWLENHEYILSGTEEKDSKQSNYYKKGGISLGIHLGNGQINIATSIDKETRYAANKTAGEKFLVENAKKPGVNVTESGLQYKIIYAGKGTIPTKSSSVKVNYIGYLIDGTEVENSYKMGVPSIFKIDLTTKGFSEVFSMMPVGSKWEVYIPQELQYGDLGVSERIPPFSTLIYEIEMLEIVK